MQRIVGTTEKPRPYLENWIADEFDCLYLTVRIIRATLALASRDFEESLMRVLTAIPVYNEERHLLDVLREVRRYSPHILVVNDGSTDRTTELLAEQKDVGVITHPHNCGYGAALISAFAFA